MASKSSYNSYVRNPYTYNAERTDRIAGAPEQQYLRARYYNPNMGRFLTKDTYPGNTYTPLTLNLYAYCGNNPVNFVDPGGHDWLNDLRSGISKAGSQISKSATQALQTLTKAGKETLSYIRTMLNLAQEEDAGKSCKLISFIDGMINELLYNTLEPIAEAGDYAVSVFGQKWTLVENFRSVYSGMESGLLNHEFTDAKSYYVGKIFGDILSIALGVGMGVASAEILGNGIAASIGITVLSDGVGVTVSVGTLVVTVAVSGVVLLEGTTIIASAVGNIGDNFNNFVNDGGGNGGKVNTPNAFDDIDSSQVKTMPKGRGLKEPYKGIMRSQRLKDAGFHFVQAIVH